MDSYISEHLGSIGKSLNSKEDKNETAAIEPVPMSQEAFPFNDNLYPTFVPKAAVEPVAIENGTSGDSMRAFVLKPEVWGIVGGRMKPYQNPTGEKEVEKLLEKNCFQDCGNQGENDGMGDLGGGEDGGNRKSNGWNKGDKGNLKDVSTMDLGMEINSFAQPLVDTRWKPVGGKAVGEPARMRQPCSSGGYSSHLI